MGSLDKREMKNTYKNKSIVGGVCCIRCSGNQRVWIQSTKNIEGLRNRFNFAIATKGCPDPSTRSDWEKYGSESFTFDVLEEIEKGENQTDKEFSEDIDVLYEMWLEKAQEGNV